MHFDYGWNSELAVDSIENSLNKLGIDLHTHVMDWEEFKDLHVSLLKARWRIVKFQLTIGDLEVRLVLRSETRPAACAK